MTTILDRIVGLRRESLAAKKRAVPEETLVRKAQEQPAPLDFAAAFPLHRVNVIAEIKKASPSKGTLREDFDPVALARSYEKGGAAAISVLTEEHHFRGSLAVLETVRGTVGIPILRKDFIVDPYQIVEARAAGADSFLLIAGALNPSELRSLIAEGRRWGMEPLVEVHCRPELKAALEAGSKLIGINNRNLKTFRVNLNVTLSLMPLIPSGHVVISESGIRAADDVRRLLDAGVRGFLIGESLVTAPDSETFLRELIHDA